MTARPGQTLVWDVQNRLYQVTGGTTETYLYDPDGQRVKKTVGSTVSLYPFAHYEITGSTVTKYYFFAGMRVAMKQGNTLTYLHADHLGSTVLETNTSGNQTADQKYRAYGKQRDTGAVVTDHKFTGQKLDGTGLQYYQSRYYDPAIGTFISPDTIVPDATSVFDYNRYMMARGNPLKYNDPTGHCVNSTTTNKDEVEITYDNDECWRIANTIGAMWDDTDYWRTRFTSPEVFFNSVANNAHNGTDFFQGQLTNFLHSDDGRQWLEHLPPREYTPVDWADYVAFTYGWGFAPDAGLSEVAIIIDQYGHFYMRGGMGANTRGFSISMGNALINTDPQARLLGARVPIDQLDISEADREQLLQNALTGHSASASGTWYLGAGASIGLKPPYHITVEEVVGAPGFSVNSWSYTFLLR